MIQKKIGKYIVPDGANVWPHEELTAKALIKYGHVVEFIVEGKRDGENTADAYIDGVKWEMKAPRGSTLKSVERNLKRGRWQSDKIVFDNNLSQIKFVNRRGEIIDIR